MSARREVAGLRVGIRRRAGGCGRDLPTGPTLGWFAQPLAGTGCPALTVPIPRAGKLPIGVQLFAAPHREELLLRVARRLEQLGVAGAPTAATA